MYILSYSRGFAARSLQSVPSYFRQLAISAQLAVTEGYWAISTMSIEYLGELEEISSALRITYRIYSV